MYIPELPSPCPVREYSITSKNSSCPLPFNPRLLQTTIIFILVPIDPPLLLLRPCLTRITWHECFYVQCLFPTAMFMRFIQFLAVVMAHSFSLLCGIPLREYTCDLRHLRGGELFLFNHPQPSLISVGHPNMARVRPSPGTSFLPPHPLGPGFPEAFVVSDPDPDCTQLTILLTSLNLSFSNSQPLYPGPLDRIVKFVDSISGSFLFFIF